MLYLLIIGFQYLVSCTLLIAFLTMGENFVVSSADVLVFKKFVAALSPPFNIESPSVMDIVLTALMKIGAASLEASSAARFKFFTNLSTSEPIPNCLALVSTIFAS